MTRYGRISIARIARLGRAATGPLGAALFVSFASFASSARAAAAPDAGAQLMKGPYLTGLSGVGVEVRFELDGAAPATVEMIEEGAEGGAAVRRTADEAASMHVVRVNGLQPGTAYAYAVRSGKAILGTGRFVTAPPDDARTPVKFLLYGDDRSNESVHASVVRSMTATPADFLVNTGDLVADGGSAADWATFFRVEQPFLRDRALFLCIGNHELYDDKAGSSFARYFGYADASGVPQPFGTVRWGSARFFFLNGMHDWEGGAERQWLERALAQADGEPGLVWRIAVVHHSPWSSGPHGGNAKLIDAHVPELLAAHHVDLLLAGHDHIYERGDAGQLKYLISGGGGAPLYPIEHPLATTRKAESTYHFIEVALTGETLRMVAHRVDGSVSGTVIESCGFSKGQPWDCDARRANPDRDVPQAVAAPATGQGSPPSSHCGCALPGAPVTAAAGVMVAVAAAGAGMARRRRRG
jgi:hypothetical protein